MRYIKLSLDQKNVYEIAKLNVVTSIENVIRTVFCSNIIDRWLTMP